MSNKAGINLTSFYKEVTMLTEERTGKIVEVLSKLPNKGTELWQLQPDAALLQLNESGGDFTIEEVIDFGEQVKAVATQFKDGELRQEDLTNVTGGISTTTAVAAYMLITCGGMAVLTVAALCCW
jgi:hypothetical protein